MPRLPPHDERGCSVRWPLSPQYTDHIGSYGSARPTTQQTCYSITMLHGLYRLAPRPCARRSKPSARSEWPFNVKSASATPRPSRVRLLHDASASPRPPGTRPDPSPGSPDRQPRGRGGSPSAHGSRRSASPPCPAPCGRAGSPVRHGPIRRVRPAYAVQGAGRLRSPPRVSSPPPSSPEGSRGSVGGS